MQANVSHTINYPRVQRAQLVRAKEVAAMYHAFALLTPKSDATVPAVAASIKSKFPNFQLAESENAIDLQDGDWDYHLAFQGGPQILAESEGLAGRIAGLDDDDPIRTCDRRFEMWSDTNDPFMEHFEKHFQMVDVLRAFNGVIMVDPREPALI
jgi:hypothetical protein